MRDEKELGVTIIDMGGGTTTIGVFHEDTLVFKGKEELKSRSLVCSVSDKSVIIAYCNEGDKAATSALTVQVARTREGLKGVGY